MTEIYTPKEWQSLFRCPSIVIDDEGYIYSAEEYKRMFRTPIGRIDYSRNNIYGKDYSSIMATPIAYLVRSGDVTKVYEYGKSQFSDPILCIQNGKIYTYSEYTRWFGGAPSGYVKKDGNSAFDDVLRSSGTGSSNIYNGTSGSGPAPSAGGDGASMPGVMMIPGAAILIGVIYLLTDESRLANAASVLAVVFNIAAAVYLLWKIGKGALHFEWDSKQFWKGFLTGLAVYVGATAVLVVLGLFSNIGTGHAISDGPGDQMELTAMFIGLPFVIAGLFKEGPAAKTQKTNRPTYTYTPPKASPKPPTPKPPVNPAPRPPVNPTPAGQAMVTDDCPRCHTRLRLPAGKGWIRVTCPKCGTSFQMRT